MQQRQGMDSLTFQGIVDEIKDLIRGSWRYRWGAIIVAWITCLAVWSYVLLMPDMYRASSRLHIDAEDGVQSFLEGMAVQSDLLEDVDLMLKSALSRPALERIASVSGYDLGDPDPNEIGVIVNRLSSALEVNLDRDNVLEIAIELPNRRVALAVVDLMIEGFVENLLGVKSDDARSAQDFLREKLAEYEALLADSEARLADFKKKNIGMMPSERGGYYSRLQQEMADLAELESMIKLARQRRATLESQMAGEAPVFGMTTSSRLSVSSPQIEGLEEQLTQLRLSYTEEHPDIIRTQELLAELRAELLAAQADNPVSAVPSAELNPVYQQMRIQFSQTELELSQLVARRSEQARIVEDLQQKMDTIPEVEAELTRLNRNYDVYRAQHTELVERLETARMSEDAGKSSTGLKFTLIDPPAVGAGPVGPNRKLFITIGLIVGLGLAAGIAAAFSLISPVFYSATRLERQFGIQVIGSIKMVKSEAQLSLERRGAIVLSLSMLALLGFYGALMAFDRVGADLASQVVGLVG